MRSLRTFAVITAMGAVWLYNGGCSDSDNTTNSYQAAAPSILRVYPADGTVGVPNTAAIAIKFNVPMDTATVKSGLHLTGGSGMQMWMDSVDQMGGMSHMNMSQQDQMMRWMDSLHLAGQFAWNGPLDSCSFAPDSALMAGADHMIFMFGQVRSRDGGMMDMGGGMMVSDTGFTYHFRTAP